MSHEVTQKLSAEHLERKPWKVIVDSSIIDHRSGHDHDGSESDRKHSITVMNKVGTPPELEHNFVCCM
jgi:hypothetical protein